MFISEAFQCIFGLIGGGIRSWLTEPQTLVEENYSFGLYTV